MSPPRHLLNAFYAVLRLFKLPQGFPRKLLLRCELLYSKLRCLLFGLLRGYSVRDGSSESAHTKNRPESQGFSDKVSDSETVYISTNGCYELENQFARIDDSFAVGSSAPQDVIPSLRSHDNVSSTVCASAVPSSASVVGSGRGHYPPARRGSSSYPDIRQTVTPLTTTTLAPRPRSINVPSPSPSRHASSLHLPHFAAPTTLSPSPSSVRLSIAELSADQHRAQARAEFIEADARSERRVRHSRAPGRSAVSGSTQSRSHSRQSLSRPSSRARPPSMVAQYPPSATSSRISLTPSEIGVIPAGDGYIAHTPTRMYAASRTPSSVASSEAPSIQLEPPSPEQGRRSSARRFSDMIGVNIQSPSSESLHTISDRYATSSPTAVEDDYHHSHISDHGGDITASDTGILGDQDAVGPGVRPDSILSGVPHGHILEEIIPLDGPRYTRQFFVSEVHYGLKVPPLCLDFPHSSDDWKPDPDLQGWIPITHSEGGLYFHHRERRIFTEAYMFIAEYFEEVELLINHLERLSEAQSHAQLPSDCELVVQVTFGGSDGEKSVMWQYYYVDHETRSLFWLRPFQVGGYLGGVYDDVSPAHFKHLLESWYWDHVSMLPDSFQSHDSLVEELVGHLTYYCVDQITSPNTTVPYTLKELANMIRLLSRKEPGAGAVPMAAALGRIMSVFCHWRFVHYHGQRCARLDRLESARESSTSQRPRTWLMKVFSFLFLFAPEVHLRDIEKVYVDEIITSYIWKRHISKLQGEWEELIAYATIILTASVSMLSVPDVILFSANPNPPGGGSNIQSYLPPLHSPAAIASYISILCSIGSIVIGLTLVHHNRTKNREDSDDAAAYMAQQDSPHFHHEPLAILYSLPYALLMWSMLSFATSVLIFTLYKTDMATQSTIAVISFGISCLIVWCATATWDSEAVPRLQMVWDAVKRMSMYRRRDSDVSSTVVDSEGVSEKSGSVPRMRLHSFVKKMRETRIPCVNDV